MSDTPALTLQDLLNNIERNAYDGISFTEDVNTAYALAAELGKTIDQLEAESAKLREVARELRANLCNRETLLELLGMPSTAETKAAMEDLFNRCNELGVD